MNIQNPQVIKTPVVGNGRQSTIGYRPDGTEQCGYYECKEGES